MHAGGVANSACSVLCLHGVELCVALLIRVQCAGCMGAIRRSDSEAQAASSVLPVLNVGVAKGCGIASACSGENLCTVGESDLQGVLEEVVRPCSRRDALDVHVSAPGHEHHGVVRHLQARQARWHVQAAGTNGACAAPAPYCRVAVVTHACELPLPTCMLMACPQEGGHWQGNGLTVLRSQLRGQW